MEGNQRTITSVDILPLSRKEKKSQVECRPRPFISTQWSRILKLLYLRSTMTCRIRDLTTDDRPTEILFKNEPPQNMLIDTKSNLCSIRRAFEKRRAPL